MKIFEIVLVIIISLRRSAESQTFSRSKNNTSSGFSFLYLGFLFKKIAIEWGTPTWKEQLFTLGCIAN